MKFLSIVGTRQQFLKAARISKELRKVGKEFLLHTGQINDDHLSQLLFDELRLPQPDLCLGVNSISQAEQTAHTLIGVERVLANENPGWVIVYGDTNSTLGGALAAAKLQIPVAYVDAGLRSFNRAIPEEVNRIMCDHIAACHFCSTKQAVENLSLEGVMNNVHLVGDVMIESIQEYLDLARRKSSILWKLGTRKGAYTLASIQQPENTEDTRRLGMILDTFKMIDSRVIFPVSPRTRKALGKSGIYTPDNLTIVEPAGYLDMLWLEANAECIMTDSGDMQKDAYNLGIRCITLHDETIWKETVEAGWNKLAGTDTGKIASAVKDWKPAGKRPPVFGDGHATQKIVEQMQKNYS